MTTPPACSHSRSVVVDAGRRIANPAPLDDDTIEAYRVAHAWRSSLIAPMRRIRREVTYRAHRLIGADGLTAARLKRMQSIRRKLRTAELTLYQMQDIGGVRVILNEPKHVDLLFDLYRDNDERRPLHRFYDYIEGPKPDGYRSRHLIFKFNGSNDDPSFARHFIELQVRTRLQHAWATAVEAVGLFQQQDIKGGEGSPDWRRLFALTSSHFAMAEGCAIVPGTPEDPVERARELRDLAGRLDAIRALNGIRDAISHADHAQALHARFYLIQYDYDRHRVTVTSYRHAPPGLYQYEEAEQASRSQNSVFVELDKIGDLKSAYPNYFLDVGLFTGELHSILHPQRPPIESAPPPTPSWRPDLSWLRGWRKSQP